LPRIIAIGFAISLVAGVITETERLISGPVLTSIVLGTYHRPAREQRIVMFLDIAGLTRLAEEMGELRVHDLITRFFFDIDEPISDHAGTVLAYVGDEVIVTWPVTGDPARNARCLACFLAIERKVARLAVHYERELSSMSCRASALGCMPVR
jgi:adenylate cyclase